jgi:hypothetical protein
MSGGRVEVIDLLRFDKLQEAGSFARDQREASNKRVRREGVNRTRRHFLALPQWGSLNHQGRGLYLFQRLH